MKFTLIIAAIMIMPFLALSQNSVNVEGTGPANLCDCDCDYNKSEKVIYSDTTLFYAVEQQAMFPGGTEALNSFIKNEMNRDCIKELMVTQKSYIKFVVERDGRIMQPEILKGCACDQEAMRLISRMPRWHPGKRNGTIVRSQFVLKIEFTQDQP